MADDSGRRTRRDPKGLLKNSPKSEGQEEKPLEKSLSRKDQGAIPKVQKTYHSKGGRREGQEISPSKKERQPGGSPREEVVDIYAPKRGHEEGSPDYLLRIPRLDRKVSPSRKDQKDRRGKEVRIDVYSPSTSSRSVRFQDDSLKVSPRKDRKVSPSRKGRSAKEVTIVSPSTSSQLERHQDVLKVSPRKSRRVSPSRKGRQDRIPVEISRSKLDQLRVSSKSLPAFPTGSLEAGPILPSSKSEGDVPGIAQDLTVSIIRSRMPKNPEDFVPSSKSEGDATGIAQDMTVSVIGSRTPDNPEDSGLPLNRVLTQSKFDEAVRRYKQRRRERRRALWYTRAGFFIFWGVLISIVVGIMQYVLRLYLDQQSEDKAPQKKFKPPY